MLTPGTRVGPYQIVDKLGEGGMGLVYRATDTKLGRDVALKILPASVTADPERLARFDREARTLASLNHPHIAQIYGIEPLSADAGGHQSALVMELVEGEDLAQRIARGPLPVDEALHIARQIADALAAAHEQRVVHRDLKPANVRIRHDGEVKVLDFGLAKAAEARSGNAALVTNSPTLASPVKMTGAATILGTAAYMSPEQARGRSVDRRADVWAFGCVLYEMATGRRPFDGSDITETLAAVMRDAPAFDAPIRQYRRADGLRLVDRWQPVADGGVHGSTKATGHTAARGPQLARGTSPRTESEQVIHVTASPRQREDHDRRRAGVSVGPEVGRAP